MFEQRKSPANEVVRGFKYRLYPTQGQVELLGQFIGVCRLVHNLALEQRSTFGRRGRLINFASQCRELTELRAAYDWIAAVPTSAQTYALRDLDQAYTAFFAGRAKYPRFRRRGEDDSFRVKGKSVAIQRLNAKWSAVRIPNLGWVKFRDTRPLKGEIRNASFSMNATGAFVSFTCQWEADAATSALPAVGIDRGVTQTLTLSTGEHMQAPDLRPLAKRHGKAQRALARCKRGSNRRAMQKLRCARLAAKARSARSDWSHRVSTDVARRFGSVAIEALKIKNMTASAAGTVDAPGRNVRQKAGLNRAILSQSWGHFATLLDYKLAERGGHLISVPAHGTSQTCASCGVVDARSRESQAVFRCVVCGHEDNADINAAKEILRRSTAWLDVEAGATRPSKRQPQPAWPGMLKAEPTGSGRAALDDGGGHGE